MRGRFAVLTALLMAVGCRSRVAPPEQPMPANTILLSAMMRELSARPGFTEALLAQLEGAKAADTKRGPALLTPALIDELRKRILGRDWQGLDRFPGWTMRAINPTVRAAGHVLAKDEALEGLSAVHPGSPPPAFSKEQASNEQRRVFLDVGPYALDQAQTVSLETPSTLPPFSTKDLLSDLGGGVIRGDGPNELAAEHAESQRLADVLNRLSANKLRGVEPFKVSRSSQAAATHKSKSAHAVDGSNAFAKTPEEVIADLQASGHTVAVTDSRYFANFGHLHYQRPGSGTSLDVMMPFWIDTQIAVPDGGGWLHRLFFRPRPLLVPVAHAEYEWHIRGPHLNADVSYYFGIDGKSEWRTMDTLDQAWVLKRNAHTYTGEQAIEVTRLAGLLTVAMLHQHARRPGLPFGGYYALGVCQDGVSAIEKKLTGRATLFPNTADGSLFDDPRDAEINGLLQAIPKDRAGAMPEPERVFGSLPTDLPSSSESQAAFPAITIPGLADDLAVSFRAWQNGTLRRTQGPLRRWAVSLAVVAALAAVAGLAARRRFVRH